MRRADSAGRDAAQSQERIEALEQLLADAEAEREALRVEAEALRKRLREVEAEAAGLASRARSAVGGSAGHHWGRAGLQRPAPPAQSLPGLGLAPVRPLPGPAPVRSLPGQAPVRPESKPGQR